MPYMIPFSTFSTFSRLGSFFLLCVFFLSATPAIAQFRNMGMQLPSVGWLGLGTTWDGVVRAVTAESHAWNVHDQGILGSGFFHALGYNLWWSHEVALGISSTRVYEGNQPPPIFSLQISTGLRYHFLTEKHRPFVSGHIQYFQLMNPFGGIVPQNALSGNQPFWVGLRLGGGYEWIFASELGLQIEANLIGLIGWNKTGWFLPASSARAALNVYF